MGDFASAIQHWEQALGPEGVDRDPRSLVNAETATFETHSRIPAILRPGNKADVQECLRIANRFNVPVYPISTGKNWGYGSRVPPKDGCVLLELSRLNRILDFNEDLAFVTVEPGVTQRSLFQYLRERKSKLWMDATGSSPDCSLIGNTMERGFGHTPYGDHFAHVCGFEVVLPTGELIETGSASFPRSLTSAVSRWGLGPTLDGLFSQSNFGIVTRMSIWLMPQPEAFEAFFFRCERSEGLSVLINTLRDLRLHEVLRSSTHIGNDYKVLSGLQQYPWTESDGKTPLLPKQMAAFRGKLNFGFWNASGGLYGTCGQVAEAKRVLRRAFHNLPGKLKFLNYRMLHLAKRFAKPFAMVARWDVSHTVSLIEPVLGLMCGVPTTQSLRSAYWRRRTPIPLDADPDRDNCGLMWYAPVAPAEGVQVARLTDIAAATLLEHGFEPMISLTMLTPRTISCVISITYDRDIDSQDQEAKRCYDALVSRCTAEGYYPYRLGIQSLNDTGRPASYGNLIRRLKKALDPNDILAPGRYDESRP